MSNGPHVLGHNPEGKTRAFLDRYKKNIIPIRNWGGKTKTYV